MDEWTSTLTDQHMFSVVTFGPDFRPDGISDHIKKELVEIEADPYDVEEWIDVAILAFDGAMRALVDKYGVDPENAARLAFSQYKLKQEKNFNRKWPRWQDADLSKAIEHLKNEDGSDVT